MVPGIEEKNGSFNTAFMRALTRLRVRNSRRNLQLYTLYDKYDEMLIVIFIQIQYTLRRDLLYLVSAVLRVATPYRWQATACIDYDYCDIVIS